MKKSRLKGKFIRTCAGCGTQKHKCEFLRIARVENGVVVDISGKSGGRGAYVCRDIECVEKVKKNGRLPRVLRVRIDAAVYDDMEKIIGD